MSDQAKTDSQGRPTHACITLAATGNYDHAAPVEYKGKSVYVANLEGQTRRLNAEKFISGQCQWRDGEGFEKWTQALADRIASNRARLAEIGK